MGQCTSKDGAMVASSHDTNCNSHSHMKRGPSDSSLSKASSTFQNLAKFLEKHPPSPEGGKKRRRSSFFGPTDSASAPVGEDLSCSLTFHMSSLEMSDRSNLMSLPGSVHSRRTSSKSPKRKISGGSRGGPRHTISSDNDGSSSTLGRSLRASHNWAALHDTTDRDYAELDPLPEELAMRSSNTTSSGSAVAAAVIGVGAQEVMVSSEEEEEEKKQDEEDKINEIQPRRRSRRRSSRDWKRSSKIYQKRMSVKEEEEGKEGEEGKGKESSWQALSCTSRNSDAYESYTSSGRSWQILTLNDSFQNGTSSRRDLARYEKDAMISMHGICFTESENEDESDSEDEDGEPVRAESQERRFWETHALRT